MFYQPPIAEASAHLVASSLASVISLRSYATRRPQKPPDNALFHRAGPSPRSFRTKLKSRGDSIFQYPLRAILTVQECIPRAHCTKGWNSGRSGTKMITVIVLSPRHQVRQVTHPWHARHFRCSEVALCPRHSAGLPPERRQEELTQRHWHRPLPVPAARG